MRVEPSTLQFFDLFARTLSLFKWVKASLFFLEKKLPEPVAIYERFYGLQGVCHGNYITALADAQGKIQVGLRPQVHPEVITDDESIH